MKKSELRKIIRDVLNEQANQSTPITRQQFNSASDEQKMNLYTQGYSKVPPAEMQAAGCPDPQELRAQVGLAEQTYTGGRGKPRRKGFWGWFICFVLITKWFFGWEWTINGNPLEEEKPSRRKRPNRPRNTRKAGPIDPPKWINRPPNPLNTP